MAAHDKPAARAELIGEALSTVPESKLWGWSDFGGGGLRHVGFDEAGDALVFRRFRPKASIIAMGSEGIWVGAIDAHDRGWAGPPGKTGKPLKRFLKFASFDAFMQQVQGKGNAGVAKHFRDNPISADLLARLEASR